MKVAELLAERQQNWHELQQLSMEMRSRKLRRDPHRVARFGALYRAACADLALADAYQLPPQTVAYLHQIVGQAHNQLYLSRSIDLSSWGQELLYHVPQRLFQDNCLRLAAVLFFGLFLLAFGLGKASPQFAHSVVGEKNLEAMENMYANPISGGSSEGGRSVAESELMTGFYVWHNTTIGLRCFAAGLIFGFGGLFEVVQNALFLGCVFGHISNVEPQREHFFEFVTAHGPFELTAIVLSAAAGMRMGFALIDTGGYTRKEALYRASMRATPCMIAAALLFFGAAFIEGFISPSGLPYAVKAMVGAASSMLLMFYFVMLGMPRSDPHQVDSDAPVPGTWEAAMAAEKT